MEFTLTKDVMVYDKEAGAETPENIVDVKFKGVKGLKSLKRMQDVIFNSFKGAASGNDKNAKDGDVTVKELVTMLELTGSSADIFECVMKELEKFAYIGSVKLSATIQDELSSDDAQGLYEAVLESFLLPKITQQMNSLKI